MKRRGQVSDHWILSRGTFFMISFFVRIFFHLDQLNIAEVLIRAGSDVNARDQYKWTPLHEASQNGTISYT